MRIIIDTHIFLWAILEPQRLSSAARCYLIDPDNTLLLSAASVWEIGIKYAAGGLPLKQPPNLLIPQQMQIQGIQALPLTIEHALYAHQLPRHHRDPFDRMILAQAMAEDLPIMTADPQFKRYDVKVMG